MKPGTPEFKNLVNSLTSMKLNLPPLPQKLDVGHISKIETLPKDVLFTLALELDLPSLMNWCQTNAKINDKVCNNSDIWQRKLLNDYPDYKKFNLQKPLKEIYKFLYQLSALKNALRTKESLYDIYLKKELRFPFEGLEKVHLPTINLPNLEVLDGNQSKLEKVPELIVPNLRILSLPYNNLEEVPPFDLPKLTKLELYGNNLTSVPSFNLPNLEELALGINKLTNVPIFNLPKLKRLSIYENFLTEIPAFDFPSLEFLSLYRNQLTSIPNLNLPKLRTLHLKDNNLSKEEKTKLKQKYKSKIVL